MVFPVLRCNLVPSCFEEVEFSSASVIVGGWQLSCVFEKLDRLSALCLRSGWQCGQVAFWRPVFLFPLLFCLHLALGGWCFRDSCDHHLFRVLPLHLAAA